MKKTLALILTLALSLTALTGCGGSKTETPADTSTDSSAQTEAPAETTLSGSVSTNGSTSMEKVIGALSEQFMADNSGVTVTYDPTGSGAGIEAATNGSADIGLSSRALKDEENGRRPDWAPPWRWTASPSSSTPSSKVADLTVEQIAKIFTGEITDWSEVGGDAGAISCIGREAGSGTRDGFESITDTKDACKLDQELTSTGGVIEAVAGNPNAIGYASLSAVEGKDTIKAVTVGGVACTEATVLDGSYAIQRPFVLVTKDGDGTLSPAGTGLLRLRHLHRCQRPHPGCRCCARRAINNARSIQQSGTFRVPPHSTVRVWRPASATLDGGCSRDNTRKESSMDSDAVVTAANAAESLPNTSAGKPERNSYQARKAMERADHT